MKIIVVGCGKIGTSILSSLAGEGNDVVAIDASPKVIEEIGNIYDVMCVCGNGTDCETLEEAGVNKAELFVADTDSLAAHLLGINRRSSAFSELMKRNPEPTLRLIEAATKAIRSSGKGKLMGVTGDVALDLSLTERLVGLGVDFLSVPPPYILEVREKIRECPE